MNFSNNCLTELSNKSVANRHTQRHTSTGVNVICSTTAKLKKCTSREKCNLLDCK